MPIRDEEILAAAQALADSLAQQRLLLTTAESCTGGGIAETLTGIAGASAWFDRGFVTYSNEAKLSMLGVLQSTLDRFGAVSEATALEMARGAISHSGAHVSVAVTGIAGPDGGTPDKPVGTVWIAWGTPDDLRTHTTVVSGSRSLFQNLIAAACLDLIRRHLQGLPPLPHYFTRQA